MALLTVLVPISAAILVMAIHHSNAPDAHPALALVLWRAFALILLCVSVCGITLGLEMAQKHNN